MVATDVIVLMVCKGWRIMDKIEIIKIAKRFVEESEHNKIPESIALSEAVVGMRIFENPIFGFGSAFDPYFKKLTEPSVIGKHFLAPQEWLPTAKTVISFFLPFTDVVKKGNSREGVWPSEEWLHGRIEGQAFIVKLCKYLCDVLTNAGYKSLSPSLDKRFWAKAGYNNDQKSDNHSGDGVYTSNWSERHIAFVCGLGTFGLSKGFITDKGIAGRLGSIVSELELSPDTRVSDNIYHNCSMCGACVKNCPVKAISLETGKNHILCSEYVNKTKEMFKPRYGCGKCQVKVPCESSIPKKIMFK